MSTADLEPHEEKGLRAEFAKAALTGLLANPNNRDDPYTTTVKPAWKYADEMLKERPI